MTAQLMPLIRTKTAEPEKPSAKTDRSHSVDTLIYRAFLLLLSISTITALVMGAWSKLNPTTYDNALMLPEWQELENQLITTHKGKKFQDTNGTASAVVGANKEPARREKPYFLHRICSHVLKNIAITPMNYHSPQNQNPAR